MSVFSTFRATNKLLIDATESLGTKVSELKAAGKEVSSKAVMEAVQKDPVLTKNFAASYVDYMAKATASGMKSDRARAEFIAGVVKSLPESLTDDTQKLRSAYRDTSRFLDEIGKTLAPVKKQESIAAVTKTLGDLTPGRFTRADLDTRLTALSQTAEKNGLIDVTLVRPKGDLKPKQAEQALLRGDSINPKEMESIKAVKQAEFDKWEAKFGASVAKPNTPPQPMHTKLKNGLMTAFMAVVGVPVLGTAIYGVYDIGTTYLGNPKDPGAFGRAIPTVIKSVPGMGNGKPGDNYAEFLLDRYESGRMDPRADLKEYYGIDLVSLQALSKQGKFSEELKKDILQKLMKPPTTLPPAKTSADIQTALRMYVTKNFYSDVAGSTIEVQGLMKDLSLAELNKNDATALTADPVNLTDAYKRPGKSSKGTNGSDVTANISEMVDDSYLTTSEATKLNNAWKVASKKPDPTEAFRANVTAILGEDKTIDRDPALIKDLSDKIVLGVHR